MARDLKLQVVLDAVDRIARPLRQMAEGSGHTAEALTVHRDRGETLARTPGVGSPPALSRRHDAARRRVVQRGERDARRPLRARRHSLPCVAGVTGGGSERQRRLTQRIRQANGPLDAPQRQRRDTARRARQASEAANGGRALDAGRAAGVATGALGLGARMLAPGVDYAAAMSRVQAYTRMQADDPRLRALNDQAREQGLNTAFPAPRVADTQGLLALNDLDPAAIHAALPALLDLAQAQETGLERTADIAARLLDGFGLDPREMERLGDVLTATTGRTALGLDRLGESLTHIAPVAREMGLSLEESAVMAGLLGDVGIRGAQAGTTLRATMERLSAPTGDAAGALGELGLNLRDAEGNLRHMPRLLADVARATEDMGDTERMERLKAIFGEAPATGLAEIVDRQGAAGIEALTARLTHAAGTNARVAAVMTDNIQNDLQRLDSAWQDIGITLAQTNEGPIRDLIQLITAVLRGIGQWMKENPGLTAALSAAVTGLTALVAVGGSFIAVLGPALRAIGAVNVALALLSAHPVVRTLMVIVAVLAGAASLIYRHWDGIAAWFGQRWADIKQAFAGGIGEVTRLLLDWSPIGLIWRGVNAGLAALGVEIPTPFESLGSAMIDGLIGGIAGGLDDLRDNIVGLGGRISDWFKDRLGINSPSRVFAGFGSGLIDGLIDGIDERWQRLKDSIGNVAGSVIGWFEDRMQIGSPSRVFARLGGDTIDGLNRGLDAQRDEPARRIAQIANSVTRAGAGLALGAATLPTAAALPLAHDVPLDARAPLPSPSGASVSVALGDIHVHPAPGMDERALARYVRAEVERALADAGRDAAVQRRSAFHDID